MDTTYRFWGLDFKPLSFKKLLYNAVIALLITLFLGMIMSVTAYTVLCSFIAMCLQDAGVRLISTKGLVLTFGVPAIIVFIAKMLGF